jgi:nucleoside-triphosphatase THEP1
MIYILKGDIETGKSKALLQWSQGRSDVYGVLSPRNDKGERFILNVNTKETFPMQANPSDDSIISVGRYHFYTSAFKRANSVILNDIAKNDSGYVIIDELGKLEMRSEGLHESASEVIQKTKHHKDLHLIIVVRTSLLNTIIKKYDIADSKIITAKNLTLG